MMILILISILGIAGAQNLFCSEEFCTKYVAEVGCPGLPDGCHIQNKTHNGLKLPFPGPCDCCKYCLENILEDESCSVGTQTSIVPSTICGPGLYCKTNVYDEYKCLEMKSECANKQADYDYRRRVGELGHMELRPNCDPDGLFKPYVCIPGEICYCVNEKNDRIFGEIPFTSLASYKMHCHCSRAHDTISRYMGQSLLRHEHMRCKSDGSYDPIQCIGKQCLCVDSDDGKPTFPKLSLVNMTRISQKTLPCFENDTHIENYYYRVCEEVLMRKVDDIIELKLMGHDIVGVVYPKCQLDGYYAPVQSDGKKQYCVTPEGITMEDYVIDLVTDEKLAKTMNCNCARALSIIQGNEKPECLKNGNYNKIQCRRGLCRCVDPNGNQIGKEVDLNKKDQLKCV
ncbi:PREDICTED: uncharacterized protein LOC108562600 [Nicrophorus vespilloides]|uniref:Uncharacterized protein LOC108562600 n=1 Tax=Nicrophorus vespilloides TaxID=110193 RepID=A0ABM1MPJ1_NICVS|nr:PREDICTED: uncharacterized protein LOC108562600 [Nicrophorus vespilloides]